MSNRDFESKGRVYTRDLKTKKWKANPDFGSQIIDAVYTDHQGRKLMLDYLQNVDKVDYAGALGVGKNIDYQGKVGKIVFLLEDGRIGKSSIIDKITPDFSKPKKREKKASEELEIRLAEDEDEGPKSKTKSEKTTGDKYVPALEGGLAPIEEMITL